MEIKKFEEELIHMTKPGINQLRHEDILADAITKSKDRSVLSWWWISIPLYVIAALLMKTLFMPGTTLISNINELAEKDKYFSLILFLIIPVLFILVNIVSIRKVYYLSGSPKNPGFLKSVWFNIIVILASVLIIIIYLI